MDYAFSDHAVLSLRKRRIPIQWLESVLAAPTLILPDADDETLEHRLARIPEYGGRVLRVVVNTRASPIRIVTLYFDRTMKSRL